MTWPEIEQRILAWHARHFPHPDLSAVADKADEEFHEFYAAVAAGCAADAVEEAADVVIVLAIAVRLLVPAASLLAAVEDKLARVEQRAAERVAQGQRPREQRPYEGEA